MSDIHFEVTVSLRGQQNRNGGRGTLQGAAVGMHAADDSNTEGESAGWIWAEGERQLFRWLDKYHWPREKSQRLLSGCQVRTWCSLGKNIHGGKSNIIGNWKDAAM